MGIKCDLHIHSCLSPCGDLRSSPRAIIDAACSAGLDIIAVTDHNSALNCRPVMAIGLQRGIYVIPGIEVASREEAHILALFPDLESALDMGDFLYSRLPDISTSGKYDQVYVDEDEYIIGELDKFLVSGADVSIEEICEKVHAVNGLVIPAHIDRPVFSIPSQLGFLPELDFDALEVTSQAAMLRFAKQLEKFAPIASSDAHVPEDVGKRHTLIDCESPTFSNLKSALRHRKSIACF